MADSGMMAVLDRRQNTRIPGRSEVDSVAVITPPAEFNSGMENHPVCVHQPSSQDQDT